VSIVRFQSQIDIRNLDLKKPEQQLIYFRMSETFEVTGVSDPLSFISQRLYFMSTSLANSFEVIAPKPCIDSLPVISKGKVLARRSMHKKRIPDFRPLLSSVLNKTATIETILADPKLIPESAIEIYCSANPL